MLFWPAWPLKIQFSSWFFFLKHSVKIERLKADIYNPAIILWHILPRFSRLWFAAPRTASHMELSCETFSYVHSGIFDEFCYCSIFASTLKKLVKWKKYTFLWYYTAIIWQVVSNIMQISSIRLSFDEFFGTIAKFVKTFTVCSSQSHQYIYTVNFLFPDWLLAHF